MNCPSAFFTDEPEDTMPVSSAPEELQAESNRLMETVSKNLEEMGV